MFVNKKNERPQEQRGNKEQRGSSFNLIASGTEVTGDVETSGDLRIDGEIVGDITCTAKLVIGESGIVRGNIDCQSGEISGTIQGQIVAKDVLQLNQSAFINGDIEAVRFIVEEGASIKGSCTTNKALESTGHAREVKLMEYGKSQAFVK